MQATSHCRSCNAPVVWTRTAFNGTPMPVDPEPATEGNLLVEVHGSGNRLVATVLPPGDPRILEETTYTSHFATCPDGDQWRKRTHA